MTKIIEARLEKIPILRTIVKQCKKIKLFGSKDLSLYDLIELYMIGIFKGAFSYRAGAIAFSFFMALFPFALFILNLIPYIPLDDFQQDFLDFIAQNVPPNTYDAIAEIVEDILNKSYKTLLSSGFILSIILMANGINAILGGFESSYHISKTRGFIRLYLLSIGLSLMLSLLLIVTVAGMVITEVIIRKLQVGDLFIKQVYLIQCSRYVFIVTMFLMTTSILFRFGTKERFKLPFISYGAIFTTLLIMMSSYFFGIYVVRFAQYNELYGSIGTLLVVMLYIWLNCMILLLGFELNASIYRLKKKG